jgi:hypothetical protein
MARSPPFSLDGFTADLSVNLSQHLHKICVSMLDAATMDTFASPCHPKIRVLYLVHDNSRLSQYSTWYLTFYATVLHTATPVPGTINRYADTNPTLDSYLCNCIVQRCTTIVLQYYSLALDERA